MGEKDKLYSGELSALDVDFYNDSCPDLNSKNPLDVNDSTIDLDTYSCTALAKLWKWIFG